MSKFEIKTKARKRWGQTYPAQPTGLFAEIIDGTLHLTGTYSNRPVDIKFKVGDVAEYDSYNLHYLGTITKITEKCVTIEPRFGGRTRRLDLYAFAWRNYDFDFERISAKNAETSMYI